MKSNKIDEVTLLFQSLQGRVAKGRSSGNPTPADEFAVLQDLAMKCIFAEASATYLDFIYMINCIQLRCKVAW